METTKDNLKSLTDEGIKLCSLKKFEEAVDIFTKACEMQMDLHGKDDANLLFEYGKALFNVAIKKSDVLGGTERLNDNNNNSNNINSNGVTESNRDQLDKLNKISGNAASKVIDKSAEIQIEEAKNKNKKLIIDVDDFVQDEFEQAENNESEEEEEEEDDDDADDEDNYDNDETGNDEQQDDFEDAWDILDLARTMFEKQLDTLKSPNERNNNKENNEKLKSLKVKLAEIYDILGEVSLESENFSQAVKDLRSSLNLKKELYKNDSTLISEAHYKISLALEFDAENENSKQEAIEEMEKAISSVKERIAMSGTDDADLLNDLNLRLEDLKNPKNAKVEDSLPTNRLPTSGAELANLLSNVKDLSNLVRKRKSNLNKTENTTNEKDQNKKSKSHD